MPLLLHLGLIMSFNLTLTMWPSIASVIFDNNYQNWIISSWGTLFLSPLGPKMSFNLTLTMWPRPLIASVNSEIDPWLTTNIKFDTKITKMDPLIGEICHFLFSVGASGGHPGYMRKQKLPQPDVNDIIQKCGVEVLRMPKMLKPQ